MIVFVDGTQGTGKTTLVNSCKYRHNRFPFNQYIDLFGLKKEDLNGFQLAKDLGIMFGLQYSNENLVFDRGPFSTVFYSLKENRYGDKTAEIMAKFIGELKSFRGFRYVIVKKTNCPKDFVRKHEDGFDYLDDENDPEKDALLDEIAKQAMAAGIKITVFENDFSEKPKQNVHRFNDMLEALMNEHDRS